jgi:yecA family protein
MEKNMEDIYEPINNSLQHVGALMDAAEAHGILCGILCTSQSYEEDVWLRHVLSDTAIEDGLVSQSQQQLLLLKKYTLEQLNSLNDEFMPLLPSDDMPLYQRVQALGGWCEGFLFGVGLTGIDTKLLPNEVKDFIDDVISVSRVAPIENKAEYEEDYMEIVEYLKVGVITLYEELI